MLIIDILLNYTPSIDAKHAILIRLDETILMSCITTLYDHWMPRNLIKCIFFKISLAF